MSGLLARSSPDGAAANDLADHTRELDESGGCAHQLVDLFAQLTPKIDTIVSNQHWRMVGQATGDGPPESA